jgi:predicted amidohydrolase
MGLKIATVQMKFTGDVSGNTGKILNYIEEAASNNARVVHFSETALTGYAGSDIESNDSIDWPSVQDAIDKVSRKAAQSNIHVILGTAYPRGDGLKPYNALLLINDRGALEDHYDKMFCTAGDVKHYTSGRRPVTFTVDGIRCGLLICYDFRFPELYREYLRRNVQVVFHAFHQVQDKANELMRQVGPAHLVSRAAENFMYIVANNCINKAEQWWSTRVINPDGSVRDSLPINEEGILVCDLDPKSERPGYYDATHENRMRAASGILYSEQ